MAAILVKDTILSLLDYHCAHLSSLPASTLAFSKEARVILLEYTLDHITL